jgi:hypothetical protein
MTGTLLSLSPHCRASSRPISHRQRLLSANRNRQRRLDAKTQIAHYKTTVPILHTVAKPNAAVGYSPVVPVRNRKIRACTGAKSP